jgi:hypothetical protein
MKKRLILLMAFSLTVSSAIAQKKLKPWTEWSLTEAEKVLTDSPWAHPQVDMELADPNRLNRSKVFGVGNEDARSRLNEERVSYFIRIYSARPIRQAFIRLVQLQQKNIDPETLARMNAFAEKQAGDSIVMAVTVDGPDAKPIEKVMQVLRNETTGTLRSISYLERSDGKRVYLNEYVPPGKDGVGARFIFPRKLDGQPFLDSKSASVRFRSEVGEGSIKFDMIFNVKEMIVDGEVEH